MNKITKFETYLLNEIAITDNLLAMAKEQNKLNSDGGHKADYCDEDYTKWIALDSQLATLRVILNEYRSLRTNQK